VVEIKIGFQFQKARPRRRKEKTTISDKIKTRSSSGLKKVETTHRKEFLQLTSACPIQMDRKGALHGSSKE